MLKSNCSETFVSIIVLPYLTIDAGLLISMASVGNVKDENQEHLTCRLPQRLTSISANFQLLTTGISEIINFPEDFINLPVTVKEVTNKNISSIADHFLQLVSYIESNDNGRWSFKVGNSPYYYYAVIQSSNKIDYGVMRLSGYNFIKSKFGPDSKEVSILFLETISTGWTFDSNTMYLADGCDGGHLPLTVFNLRMAYLPFDENVEKLSTEDTRRVDIVKKYLNANIHETTGMTLHEFTKLPNDYKVVVSEELFNEPIQSSFGPKKLSGESYSFQQTIEQTESIRTTLEDSYRLLGEFYQTAEMQLCKAVGENNQELADKAHSLLQTAYNELLGKIDDKMNVLDAMILLERGEKISREKWVNEEGSGVMYLEKHYMKEERNPYPIAQFVAYDPINKKDLARGKFIPLIEDYLATDWKIFVLGDV